jgi:hypothetical protein
MATNTLLHLLGILNQTGIKAQGSRFNLLLCRFGLQDSSSAITLLHEITESSGRFADYHRTLWNLDGLSPGRLAMICLFCQAFRGYSSAELRGIQKKLLKRSGVLRSTDVIRGIDSNRLYVPSDVQIRCPHL